MNIKRSMPALAGNKQDGRFQPGQSGNPHGRRKGERNKALMALDTIGQQAAGDILQAVVAAARDGDMTAAKILLDRLWPPTKSRPITIALPPVSSAADLPTALAAVIAAVSCGELSLDDGRALAALLESTGRVIELADMEARIAALEQRT